MKRALIVLAGNVLAGAVPAAAATFTVDRTDDNALATSCSDVLSNDCSLRGAILRANAAADADTIILPAGTYSLTILDEPFPLREGPSGVKPAIADLDVTASLTIVGAGAATTVIQAGPALNDRVFHISGTTAAVAISGVTIRNGLSFDGGGILNAGGGAVTLTNVTVAGNLAHSEGGGIKNDVGGVLTLTNVTIGGNHAGQLGGGILNQGGEGRSPT